MEAGVADSGRRAVVVPIVICVLALGALTRSNALDSIRAVDAVLIFVAGVSAGVAFVRVLGTRAS